MKQIYVPKEEITTYPNGWNETEAPDSFTTFYDSFSFLKDPREDIYSFTSDLRQI